MQKNAKLQPFQGNYLEWLVDEFKGWRTFTWAIWTFGVGFQLMSMISQGINASSIITFLGVSIGLLCTCGMLEQKTVNGLLGFISAIALIYVNWEAKHYASVIDQVFFMSLIDLPLMVTWRTWGAKMSQGVKQLNGKGWVIVIAVISALWAVLYPTYVHLNDSNPVWDSLTLAIGAVASVLFFLRYTQTYNLWLAANVVNLVLWLTALHAGYTPAAFAMVVSTIMYLATSLYGRFFSDWAQKPTKQALNTSEPKSFTEASIDAS